MNSLGWTVEKTEERTVVRFTGELDMTGFAEAEQVVQAAEETGRPLLVLDRSDLEFMDSNGLHLLLLASGRAKQDSHRLAVVPGKARRLLELTGMLDLFEILDESLRPSQA